MDSLCWRRSPSAVDRHDTGVGRLDQSLKAKVVMTGMASDEAKSMFADIMKLTSLVPLGEARLGRIGLDEWLRSRPAA